MSSKLVLSLAKQVQEMGAGSGHAVMNNIKHTKDLTAVISIYDGEKPSHMVLDELYEWAEENNKEVSDKIKELEQDMTWNDENPI